MDGLGYQKRAQSIGGGRPALFGNEGVSYPTLYPVVLAPIHALELSGRAAYGVGEGCQRAPDVVERRPDLSHRAVRAAPP